MKAKQDNADWNLAKGFDQSAAVSEPVSKEAVPDWQNVDLHLSVNGQTKQQANTKMMLVGVPQMLAHISQFLVLNEGDLIFTGTPAGVGPIVKGDKLEATMTNGNESEPISSLKINVQ